MERMDVLQLLSILERHLLLLRQAVYDDDALSSEVGGQLEQETQEAMEKLRRYITPPED